MFLDQEVPKSHMLLLAVPYKGVSPIKHTACRHRSSKTQSNSRMTQKTHAPHAAFVDGRTAPLAGPATAAAALSVFRRNVGIIAQIWILDRAQRVSRFLPFVVLLSQPVFHLLPVLLPAGVSALGQGC